MILLSFLRHYSRLLLFMCLDFFHLFKTKIKYSRICFEIWSFFFPSELEKKNSWKMQRANSKPSKYLGGFCSPSHHPSKPLQGEVRHPPLLSDTSLNKLPHVSCDISFTNTFLYSCHYNSAHLQNKTALHDSVKESFLLWSSSSCLFLVGWKYLSLLFFFLFALQLTVFLISLALPQHINIESSFQSENIQFLLVILQPSQKQKPRDALFVHLS